MSGMKNAKSYAEEGLEEVSSESSQAEVNVGTTNKEPSGEEGEFQQVGGLEPVAFYYRTSAPKKPTKSAYRIIENGQTITGTYERQFTSGKYGNPTYLIRLDSGELSGLSGTGSLNKAMERLAEGSKVKITYNGMKTIAGGKWEGNDAHTFTVLGNKLRQ